MMVAAPVAENRFLADFRQFAVAPRQ
jgi:hypothetical protein